MGSVSRFNKLAEQADEGMRSEASQIYLLLKDDRLSEDQKKDLKARLDKILINLDAELKAVKEHKKD